MARMNVRQRAGDEAGQHQRQSHPAKQAKAMAAEILRHLFEGGVDVRQRHHGVEQYERKKVQRLHQDDAGEPFHERDRDIEPVSEQQINHAAAAQNQLQRDRANKWRDHQRQGRGGLQQQLAAKLIARQHVGQRQSQERAKDDDEKAAP